MTKEENIAQELYRQEVFVLAYLYAHPEQFDECGLLKTHFMNEHTGLLFELMYANYRHNQSILVNSVQVIDGMWKNKRFNVLLDNPELTDIVFARSDDYLITRAIFNGYIRVMKQKNRGI